MVKYFRSQESRKAYGTAVGGVVIQLNEIPLNHSQRGQLVKHVLISFACCIMISVALVEVLHKHAVRQLC